MARRTVITRREDDDDEERRERAALNQIKSDPAEESYGAFIQGFRSAQGCRVKVYRQTPRGRQYCFFGTPEEIDSEETIRLFHAKQPYAHEEGTYLLGVEVNGEQRNLFPVHVAPQINTPGTEQHLNTSGGMADSAVLRMLQEQNARLEARLLQSEKTPVSELISGMTQLDAMRGTKELPIDTLMKAVEIGTRLNGSGASADGDSWMGMIRDLVKEAAPTIVPALGAILTRAMASQKPPQQQPDPPAITEGVKTDMAPEQQEQQILQAHLQQAIQFLKKKAMSGSDPGLYIDIIVDNREEPLYARLISQIVEQDFSAFTAIDADISKPQFNSFFRAIYDGVRSVFIPEDPVGHNSSGKAGNKADAPSNGASGKKGGK